MPTRVANIQRFANSLCPCRTNATLGISFFSAERSGCPADISYEGIEGLPTKSSASLATVLGYAAAQEIGRLLLGTDSHTPYGIIRAVWEHDELEGAKRGTLFFPGQTIGTDGRKVSELRGS